MENRDPHLATQRLLDLLAHEQWVPEKVLRRLRRAAQREPQHATAGAIARWLVDEGLLDRETAKRLVKAARMSAEGTEDDGAAALPSVPVDAVEEEVELVILPEEVEDLLVEGPADSSSAAAPPPVVQPTAPPRVHENAGGAASEAPPRGGSPLELPGPSRQDRAEAPGPRPGSMGPPRPGPAPGGPAAPDVAGLDPLEQLLTAGTPGASPVATQAVLGSGPLGGGPPNRSGAMVGRGPGRGRSGPRVRRSRWDSNLLLVGGGMLLLLLFLAWLLLFGIQRQSGDEAFRLANEDYQNGRYAEAIRRFDGFLEQHADHPRASLARVRRGLARLRQAVDERRDGAHALSVAQEVLRDIRPEKEFVEAQAELRTLLPRIASSLAAQADAAGDFALLQQARQAYELALNPHHVPPSLRNEAEYRALEQQLADIELRLGRDQRRDAALAAIRAHIAQGAPQQAFAERAQLLKVYPMLVGDERLQAAMAEASAAEIALVQFVATGHQPQHEEPATGVETNLLAQTEGAAIPGLQGKTVLAVVDGAVYGFDAASGRPLWRRYLDPEATGLPLRVPGERIVLLLPAQSEAICVEQRTGQLAWRQPLPGRPMGAVLVPGGSQPSLAISVQLPDGTGNVLLLEAGSGMSIGQFVLPQGGDVAPAVDASGRFAFHCGTHSSLYVLDLQQRQCVAVAYQGHEPHAIRTPPLVQEGLLVVFEASAAAQTRMHLWNVRDPAQPLRLAVQVSMSGHVHQQPSVLQQRVAVATDLGAVHVLELRPDDETRPLVPVAERRATRRVRTPYYPLLLQPNELLVAGDGLVRYEVQAAAGTLQPRWVQADDDAASQPLQIDGPWVFHLRKRRGQPGAVLAAYQRSDGQRQWETQFAVPLAAAPRPLDNPPRVVAVNRAGVAYALPADKQGGQTVAAVPPRSGTFATPLPDDQQWLELDAGCGALPDSARQGRVLIVDPQCDEIVRYLPVPYEAPGAAGSYLHKLLVGDRFGQVHVLDAASGMALGEPFQRPMAPGESSQWLVCRGGETDEVLLADQQGYLYVLRMRSAPRPHLAAVRQSAAPLPHPLVSPPACLGDVAYAVDAAGTLLAIWLADLTVEPLLPRATGDTVDRQRAQPGAPATLAAAAPHAAASQVAAARRNDADTRRPGTAPQGDSAGLPLHVRHGPVRVGNRVLVATFDDRLICLDDRGQVAWNEPLPDGPLAGVPWPDGDVLICATVGGRVFPLAMDDGCLRGAVRHLGQPLGTGPVACHGRLVVAAYDGNLLQVDWP